MHVVHYPKELSDEFLGAAIGILFSVEEYNANLTWSEQVIIDSFFDSLKWTDLSESGPIVDLITFGNLM